MAECLLFISECLHALDATILSRKFELVTWEVNKKKQQTRLLASAGSDRPANAVGSRYIFF